MSGRKSSIIILLVIFCYLIITLVYTAPLVQSISNRAPVDDVDPLFNSWVVAHNGHALVTDPVRLFSANMFYPYSNTLAYSDLMLPPSILMSPVNLLAPSPVVAYNLLIILSFVFSATAMYLLAKSVTGSGSAGFIAGVAYAFSTYRVSQMGHLQLMMDGFMVLMLYFAHRYLGVIRLRYLVLAGVALSLQALSGWYYGFYSALILLFFLGFFIALKEIPLNRRLLGHLLVLATLVGVSIVPFTLPYLTLRATLPNFSRTLSEAVHFSASALDYVSTQNPILIKIFGGSWVPSGADMWEHLLFPGFFALIGAVVAIVFMFRGSPRSGVEAIARWKIKLFYVVLALVAMVLSFGPYLMIGDRKVSMPYLLAWNIIPGFKSMRVPARFGLIVTMALILLAAYGFAELASIINEKFKLSQWVKYGLVAAVAGVVLITQITWPFLLSPEIPVARDIPPVYKWLAKKSGKAILELPSVDISGDAIVGGWGRDVRYLYFSTFHWSRLVNGYSGYAPPEYSQIIEATAGFPDPTGVAVLRRLGVDYLVYHTSGDKKLSRLLMRRARGVSGIRGIRLFGDDIVFELASKTSARVRPRLSLVARGPKTAPASGSINIAWRIRNRTNKRIVIAPHEQPRAKFSWSDGSAGSILPRFPLVIGPRQTAWMSVPLETPSRVGKSRLTLELDSPLVGTERDILEINIKRVMSNSLDAAGLKGRFGRVRVAGKAVSGSKVPVVISLKNTGDALWRSKYDRINRIDPPLDYGEIHLAALWFREGKQIAEPQVFSLAHDVGPGDRYTGKYLLEAPGRPGTYLLKLDLVSLGVAWFNDLGINNPSIKVDIYDKKR